MAKRLIGLIVAFVLALSAGATAAGPAWAAPNPPAKSDTTKATTSKEDKAAAKAKKAAAAKAKTVKAAQAKAAKEAAKRKAAAAAKAKKAAEARKRAILQAGPKAAAAAKAVTAARQAAAVAKTRAAASARAAVAAKAKAAATARSATAAKAKSNAVAKSKASKKDKKKAKNAAKSAKKQAEDAAQASSKAAKAAAAAARASTNARKNVVAKTKAAAAAKITYIGYAKQRADLTAAAAKPLKARSAKASKIAKTATAHAKAAAKKAADAKKKAAAANKKASKPRAAATASGQAALIAKSQAATAKKAAKAASKASKKAAKSSKKAAKAAKKAAKKAKKAAKKSKKAKRAKEAAAQASAAAAAAGVAATRAAATAKASQAAAAKAAETGKVAAAAAAAARAPIASATAATKTYQAAAATAAAAKATAARRNTAAKKAKAIAKKAQSVATKAKKAAGPNATWSPNDYMTFNNPKGPKKKKRAIITDFVKAIKSVPAGGQIRMAQYLFDIKSVASALIAADKRGVSVQVLIDDGESNKHIRRVKKALGKNKKKRSFVATCHHSCMSNGASVIHAKFYLFSVAGQRKYVSMISSANAYTGNTNKSWNNNHVIVADKVIYDSLNRYFTDMLKDKSNRKYFRSTSSGKYTMWLYPQTPKKTNDIVWMKALNQVQCKSPSKGYGSDGRTLIRLANWGWSSPRIDVAEKLVALHRQGCKVQVMINRGRITKPVLRTLLRSKSKKYGKMGVYDGWHDRNNNGHASLYVHHKMMTINGRMAGQNVKITWTGSQNFTGPGTFTNNDIVLRIVDPRVTKAYEKNFAYIRGKATKRVRTMPWSVGRTGLALL
ncbi:MAG: phospholipase D-like domain-containing protein [Microlunatus sp.]|nr:phospholipase D-like domain-containing protein [Microlunatus sp.]